MKLYKPYLISALITCLTMQGIAFAIENPQQAHSTRIVGLIVTAIILAAPIYAIDKWSVRYRTLIHFVTMSILVIPLLMMSGWFEWKSPDGLLMMVGVFLAFGIVGWVIGFSANALLRYRSKSV